MLVKIVKVTIRQQIEGFSPGITTIPPYPGDGLLTPWCPDKTQKYGWHIL